MKFSQSNIRLIMRSLLKVGVAEGSLSKAAGAEPIVTNSAKSVEEGGTENVESWSDNENAILAHCLLAIVQDRRAADAKPASQELVDIPKEPLSLFKLQAMMRAIFTRMQAESSVAR